MGGAEKVVETKSTEKRGEACAPEKDQKFKNRCLAKTTINPRYKVTSNKLVVIFNT
jgi:hypothetical protein